MITQGDTVILKSGGPIMVIDEIVELAHAVCVWGGVEGMETIVVPIVCLDRSAEKGYDA